MEAAESGGCGAVTGLQQQTNYNLYDDAITWRAGAIN